MNRTNPGGKNPIHASAKVGAAITALKVCRLEKQSVLKSETCKFALKVFWDY